jgi:hypothetical protein
MAGTITPTLGGITTLNVASTPNDPAKKSPITATATTPEKKPDEEKKPEPTEADVTSFVDQMFGGVKKPEKKKAKAEEKKEEKKPEPVVEKKDEPKPDAEKKSESTLVTGSAPVPEKKEEARQQPIDEEKLADRVADRITERSQQKLPDNREHAEELNDQDREILLAVKLLQNEPQYRNRNLEKETLEFWKKESDYISKWESEHDGEEFDEKAKEHRQFYQKNAPEYSDADLARAVKQVGEDRIVQRARAEARRESQSELEAIKAERAQEKAAPLIQQAADQSITRLIIEAVPEFKELLDDGKGNFIPTAEAVQEMREQFPTITRALETEGAILRETITEVQRIQHLGGYYAIDPNMRRFVGGRWIYPHAEIVAVGDALENAIASLPADKQVSNDGKKFVRLGDLEGSLAKIKAGNGTREEKLKRMKDFVDAHWVIGIEDIGEKIIKNTVKHVRGYVETLPKVSVKKKGTAKNEKAAETTEKKPDFTPPSTASSSDVTNNTVLKPGDGGGNTGDVVDSLFPR